jgi:hypothetical protein
MPIGNLTSQIFANIYLNELDRFVKHTLGVKCYVRYGDDIILIHQQKKVLECWQQQVTMFLHDRLQLTLHRHHNIIVQCRQGVRFLGVTIWPNSIRLHKRSVHRIIHRLNQHNVGSYYGLVMHYGHKKLRKLFGWLV